MKNFFDYQLIERFGYAMAVYITAKASTMQKSIDASNLERKATGRRLLENVSIDEVISVMRRKGRLPS
jgi:hypothetical protein